MSRKSIQLFDFKDMRGNAVHEIESLGAERHVKTHLL